MEKGQELHSIQKPSKAEGFKLERGETANKRKSKQLLILGVQGARYERRAAGLQVVAEEQEWPYKKVVRAREGVTAVTMASQDRMLLYR